MHPSLTVTSTFTASPRPPGTPTPTNDGVRCLATGGGPGFAHRCEEGEQPTGRRRASHHPGPPEGSRPPPDYSPKREQTTSSFSSPRRATSFIAALPPSKGGEQTEMSATTARPGRPPPGTPRRPCPSPLGRWVVAAPGETPAPRKREGVAPGRLGAEETA